MPLTTEQQNRLDLLMRLVAARVEEYLESADDAASIDVPGIGNIEDELHDAAKYVLKRIDRSQAYRFAKNGDGASTKDDADKNCTFVVLPADYLRFVRVELAGWKYAVSRYKSEEHPDYRKQQFEHLRATINRPEAFLVPYFSTSSTDSNQALECYPQGAIDQLVYVPALQAYDMPKDLDSALTWKAASAVLLSMREPALADNALKESERHIQAFNTGGNDGG